MSPAASQLTHPHVRSNGATYADSLSSRTSSVRGFHLRSMSGSSDETMVESPEERNVKVASNRFRIKAQRSLSIRSAATAPSFLRLKRSSNVDRPPSPALPSPVIDRLTRQRADSTTRKARETTPTVLPAAPMAPAQMVRVKELSSITRTSRSRTESHGSPKIGTPSKLRRPKSFAAFVDVEVEEDSEEDEVAKETRLLVAAMNRRWILQECQCPYDKQQLKACVM
ncbi:uncharacterized protein EV420DRAFT_1765926 [Desarmillaria tabescens]|uniref:Uncharacterized protein n=1 Tax=Armillaria tabescens TaxID=1929756 RepID=A0AA39K6I0_ARMTA|nr:uncharacterized protein EV420DRAFT_1765926 [Desarmillaria tabescens]KAK0454119.1 hypothetical protein EV420DRAFT_1765926 [Desarmillaria tabescens]